MSTSVELGDHLITEMDVCGDHLIVAMYEYHITVCNHQLTCSFAPSIAMYINQHKSLPVKTRLLPLLSNSATLSFTAKHWPIFGTLWWFLEIFKLRPTFSAAINVPRYVYQSTSITIPHPPDSSFARLTTLLSLASISIRHHSAPPIIEMRLVSYF